MRMRIYVIFMRKTSKQTDSAALILLVGFYVLPEHGSFLRMLRKSFVNNCPKNKNRGILKNFYLTNFRSNELF